MLKSIMQSKKEKPKMKWRRLKNTKVNWNRTEKKVR